MSLAIRKVTEMATNSSRLLWVVTFTTYNVPRTTAVADWSWWYHQYTVRILPGQIRDRNRTWGMDTDGKYYRPCRHYMLRIISVAKLVSGYRRKVVTNSRPQSFVREGSHISFLAARDCRSTHAVFCDAFFFCIYELQQHCFALLFEL